MGGRRRVSADDPAAAAIRCRTFVPSLSRSAVASPSPLPPRQGAPPLLCLLASEAVSAGFPSPADDYVEGRIDLNVELIPRPLSTFFMRVSGDAMRGDGIVDGDLLVIDRSVDPRPGMVVVAVHAGCFLLRRLARRGARLWLVASDGASPPLKLSGDLDSGDLDSGDAAGDGEAGGAELWGVVIHAVHHLAGAPSRRR
jgi:DNA polymerase V